VHKFRVQLSNDYAKARWVNKNYKKTNNEVSSAELVITVFSLLNAGSTWSNLKETPSAFVRGTGVYLKLNRYVTDSHRKLVIALKKGL